MKICMIVKPNRGQFYYAIVRRVYVDKVASHDDCFDKVNEGALGTSTSNTSRVEIRVASRAYNLILM